MVFGGGIIPEEDIPLLKEMGVAKVFTPGAPTTRDRRVGPRELRRRLDREGLTRLSAAAAGPVVSGIRSMLGADGLVLTVTGCGAALPA